jgi:AraC-like DNA-binding protein
MFMAFNFNIYSTPLLFGFLQAWIYAGLFAWRGWRFERLSDYLFAALLFAFSFEIWEYMLGFGGIDILWNQLEFVPRNFAFLLPALAYFYLKSQFNRDFSLQRQHLWHALPFLVYVVYHLIVFAQGRDFVNWWKPEMHEKYGIPTVYAIVSVGLQVYYFYRSFQLYQAYVRWTPTQYADTETVSFRWFRTFLTVYVISNVVGLVMSVVDIAFSLDFVHDWWDELFNACLIYFLTIAGYSQVQPRHLHFNPEPDTLEQKTSEQKNEKIAESELKALRDRLTTLMDTEKPYLEPDINLGDLAKRMGTNASVLSAVINGAFEKNFNDFINGYRVTAVQQLLNDPAYRHLSLLGIGFECGFNSKSTFNRAYKKATGQSPGASMSAAN